VTTKNIVAENKIAYEAVYKRLIYVWIAERYNWQFSLTINI